jgi:hypothetical protein
LCTTPPPPPPPLALVWAGRGEVDDLIGVEVGVVVVGWGDGDGESLPLARAAPAGFDEDEGGAEEYAFACAGWVGGVEDGSTEESPSSHSSPGSHPRFSRTLMGSPFWVYVSRNTKKGKTESYQKRVAALAKIRGIVLLLAVPL